MTDYMEGVAGEYHEMITKLQKVNKFIDGGKVFRTLPVRQQRLLVEQRAHMTSYAIKLYERLEEHADDDQAE